MSNNSSNLNNKKETSLISDERVIEQLGEKVRALRLRKNLTQTELAKDSGVGKSTIERFERGASIQLTSLVRVMRALGRLDDLLEFIPDQRESPVSLMLKEEPTKYRASKKRTKNANEDWKWGDE